jgi:hypothetical protein
MRSVKCSRCGRRGHYAPGCTYPEKVTKRCNECGLEKPRGEYTGENGRCEPCMKVARRAYARKRRKRLRAEAAA